MKLYCANCGKQLERTRKVIPNSGGIIVDLVSYHECSAEPVPFEIDPSEVFIPEKVEGKDKFVKSLNDLKTPRSQGMASLHKEIYGEGKSLRPSSMVSTADLRDRRYDQPTSTAPKSIVESLKPTIPEHELKNEPPDDSEMGG